METPMWLAFCCMKLHQRYVQQDGVGIVYIRPKTGFDWWSMHTYVGV